MEKSYRSEKVKKLLFSKNWEDILIGLTILGFANIEDLSKTVGINSYDEEVSTYLEFTDSIYEIYLDLEETYYKEIKNDKNR